MDIGISSVDRNVCVDANFACFSCSTTEHQGKENGEEMSVLLPLNQHLRPRGLTCSLPPATSRQINHLKHLVHQLDC